MKIINAEMVKNALNQAVQEKGFDYVYTDERGLAAGKGGDCRNWRFSDPADEDSPRIFMCIAGKAYFHLGIEEELVGPNGTDCAYTPAADVARYLENSGLVKFTPIAMTMLMVAQRVQDNGGNWGSALAAAEAVQQAYEASRRWVGADITAEDFA